MKSVFVAGSRKFFDEIEILVGNMRKKHIPVSTAGTWDKAKPDTFASEKKALLLAFRQINKGDILYVYARKGYIGKTVAMEIGYAFSQKKEIISSEEIGDFSARALVSRVVRPERLIAYCLR